MSTLDRAGGAAMSPRDPSRRARTGANGADRRLAACPGAGSLHSCGAGSAGVIGRDHCPRAGVSSSGAAAVGRAGPSASRPSVHGVRPISTLPPVGPRAAHAPHQRRLGHASSRRARRRASDAAALSRPRDTSTHWRWTIRISAGLLAAVLATTATLTASASALPGDVMYGLKTSARKASACAWPPTTRRASWLTYVKQMRASTRQLACYSRAAPRKPSSPRSVTTRVWNGRRRPLS